MNYRRPLLDPEVEQLLREIASQPGSILLKASYTPFRRRVLTSAPNSRRAVSLDSARCALEDLERAALFRRR